MKIEYNVSTSIRHPIRMKMYAELMRNHKNIRIKSLMDNIMRPKAGKSTVMAAIDNNLIVDLEDGYRSLSVMKIQARNYNDFVEIRKALKAKMEETGKIPYKFITIDNATRLEEYSLSRAAELYRNTPMGASYGYKKDPKNPMMPLKDKNGNKIVDPKADVRTLPNGAGYGYLRKAVTDMINMFQPFCETLILVGHVKEKQIRVDSEEMTEMSIDLAGKTGDIVCGQADAIGYLFRRGKDTILSFKGGEGSVREARPTHLRGQEFVVATSDENNNIKVDLSKIFI